MTVIAYVLVVFVVPVLATLTGGLLTLVSGFLGGGKFFTVVSLAGGAVEGMIGCTLIQKIFLWLGVTFTNTPLWLYAGLILLNDFARIGRRHDPTTRKHEVAHLVGFLVGVNLWANHIQ
jgi:hypothetical protein